MLRKTLLLPLSALLLAACTDSGQVKNPFHEQPPFIPTAVPADFAVKVDENHDTYYSRQHIDQTITLADSLSKTTYTTFRDYNNTVSNKFSQETPLSAVQLQNMWNDVARYNLLNRSTIWVNWISGADLYKRDAYTIQIRANGQTRTYRQTNGFSGPIRPLVLQIEAVRLPISQNSTTPVVSPHIDSSTPSMEDMTPISPATQPAATQPPATLPLTPETKPAATQAIVPAKPESSLNFQHDQDIVPATSVGIGQRQ